MNQKGFSLIEMLLVVVLMAVILAGLAGVQGTLLQQKGRVIQDILVQSQADAIRKKILMELSEATLVTLPAPPAGAPPAPTQGLELQGFKNVDPGTNLKLVASVANMYYFRFCAANIGSWNLYYYYGSGNVIPAVACGTSCKYPGCMQLGGGPTNAYNITDIRPCLPDPAGFVPAPTSIFQRPRNNFIQAALSVKFDSGQTTQDKARLGNSFVRCSDVGTGVSLPLSTTAP